MSKRFSLILLSALLLTACSSTPDRYAFWRNGTNGNSSGRAPNLGDVPAAPETDAAKAEMEAMRQRLETERQNAFRAADGLAPLPSDDANDLMQPPMENIAPPQAPTQTWQNGNVQFNAMPAAPQEYVYGNSPVQYKSVNAPILSNDPSIVIDTSVFDSSPAYMGAPSAMGDGETVAFFSHGSAGIDRHTRAQIDALAKKLQQTQRPIVLVGHASQRTGINDPITSQMVNLRMASKRAETVMRELSRHGVTPDKVKITSMGDAKPNSNPQGKAQEAADRRVEILFD